MMKKPDEQGALIFIPDISGFTQFVNDRELKHTHHIIAELLEILIEANQLNLEVSEIEGDAILFYRLGESPPVNEIVKQCKAMYVAFHRHLKKYGISRICNCGACKTAGRLTLKTIAHYGSVSFHKIKNHEKLFGSDVIKAHRLLKNNIPQDEYILISEAIAEEASENKYMEKWVIWNKGNISYDVGDINYAYASLQPVYSEIPEPELTDVKLHRSQSPMIFTIDIHAPLEIVYEAFIDLKQRMEWMTGLKAIKIEDEPLTRMNKICTSFECTLEHEKCTLQTSNAEFGEHVAKFSETLLEHPITFDYLVEEADGKIKLRLECHSAFSFPMKWMFNLFMKRKFKAETKNSLVQLKNYCEKKIR
jgi:hypothetical protein